MALIQEVKTIAKWVIDFGEDIDEAFGDGWQWKDLSKFVDNFFSVPALANAAPIAWAAIKVGLPPADRAELVIYVESEFDIPHKDAEQKIEATFKWLAASEEFIRLFIKKKP